MIDVVGEASDGAEAIELVRSLRPDVVVMDITMPGSGGLDALRRLTREDPGVRVIMLSMHDREEYVWEALQAGAAGYILKDASLAELELAIAVGGTGPHLPRAGHHAPRPRGPRPQRPSRATVPPERLTARQRQVLRLDRVGRSNREIAHELGLSTKTVESHRAEVMKRLGIHDLAGIVRYAVRAGLVASDE